MAVLIVDMGSQYTHVIWRTLRDLGKEAKVVEKQVGSGELSKADALIFSGGPSSVTTDNFFEIPKAIQEAKSPMLGICLGHQLIAHVLGGKVEKGKNAEYGVSRIEVDEPGAILAGIPNSFNAWVSHFDEIKKMPSGFVRLAHSETCQIEAMENVERKIFSLQFHPEVWHTEHGERIIQNFLELI